MASAASITSELKKKGIAQTQKTYSRHRMAPERTLGVSIADLKPIAKTIKGQQSLACELYDTGKMEAMYLAALVADGKQMTAKQLDRWAEKAFALRVKPLAKQAKAAAKQIGAVVVDVGDTECKLPLATAYIEKIELAGRLGRKRKTIRC